jgi:hypothetical protein
MPRQENLIRSQTCMQLYFSSSFRPRTSKYGEDSDSEVDDQEENVSTDNVCTSKRRKLADADVPVVVTDEGIEDKNIAFVVDGREGGDFIERHVRFRNYYNISSDGSRDSLQRPTVRTAVLSRHEGSLQKLQGISIAATGQEPLSNDVCKLTFLGTGCASPSKFRHNSAILITFPRGSAPLPAQIPGPLSGFRPPPPRGPPPPPLLLLLTCLSSLTRKLLSQVSPLMELRPVSFWTVAKAVSLNCINSAVVIHPSLTASCYLFHAFGSHTIMLTTYAGCRCSSSMSIKLPFEDHPLRTPLHQAAVNPVPRKYW